MLVYLELSVFNLVLRFFLLKLLYAVRVYEATIDIATTLYESFNAGAHGIPRSEISLSFYY